MNKIQLWLRITTLLGPSQNRHYREFVTIRSHDQIYFLKSIFFKSPISASFCHVVLKAVNYNWQTCRNSVFTSCKMRKENIISNTEMYNFDGKKFRGKFELSLEFGFSIWLLVTTADINKPDLSSWIYLYYTVFALCGSLFFRR